MLCKLLDDEVVVMTFHGQSMLSCVWGVTHAAAVSEPPAEPVGIRQQSAPRSLARLRVLSRVVRKLRSSNSSVEAGPGSSR